MLRRLKELSLYERMATAMIAGIFGMVGTLVVNQKEGITYTKVSISYMQNMISDNKRNIKSLAREFRDHERRHPIPKESYIPRDIYNKLDQRQVRPKDKL